MAAYQTYLKPELAALAESHPNMTPRERLQMARQKHEAQICLIHHSLLGIEHKMQHQ